MFGFSSKHKELEAVLLRLNANASNNYKDAAQANYKEFLQLYETLKADKKLNKKQLKYYEDCMERLAGEMKNYSHKDQHADFQGLGELLSKRDVTDER